MKDCACIYKRSTIKLFGTTAFLAAGFQPKVAFSSCGELDNIEQPLTSNDESFIERAFEMRDLAVSDGDQAYGALVVKDSVIIGQGPSKVITNQDPTAHAEMEAIRNAALRLKNRNLRNCILYSSSRPCLMCEAAAYWAGIDRMIFGKAINDAGSPSLRS